MTPTITAINNENQSLFFTTSLLLEKEKQREIIQTGSRSFNELLGGGVRFGKVTEVYGEPTTGKTQLGLSLIINLHKLNNNYKTIMIDTEDSFEPSRLKELSELHNLDSDFLLKNVIAAKTNNIQNQVMAIKQSLQMISTDPTIKLVIIDSISNNLRKELRSKKELCERQGTLAGMVKMLSDIASEKGVAVYITNQVCKDPTDNTINAIKPIGGSLLSHFSHYRIYLRQGKKELKIAELVDSSHLANDQCVYVISRKGILDP